MKNVAIEDEILGKHLLAILLLFKVYYMEIFLGKHLEHVLVILFCEVFLFLLYCIFL